MKIQHWFSLVFLTLSAFVSCVSRPQIGPPPDDLIKSYQGNSKWRVSYKTDPFTDSRVITYGLKATTGESSWGTPIWLVIRDTDRSFELYVDWGEYLGSDISVTHRVDARQPRTQKWSISTDNEASFYKGSGSPTLVELLDELKEARKFAVKTTPWGENPTTAIFDVSGLREVMEANGG